MSKIFTVVRNIVAERSGITPKSLEGCTNLEAVGLDGMDMSELIMAIEDEFDISIPDEELDLDYCREAVTGEFSYALSNSLGFGGHNASILIKKYV